MSFFLILCLLATVVYLASRVRALSEQLGAQERRLAELEARFWKTECVSARSPEPAAPEPAAAPADLQGVPPVVAAFQALPPSPPPPIAASPLAPEPAVVQKAPPPLAPPAPPPASPWLRIDWEQFMGVKLFAWIGGFVLFLGVAFLVKYSFDRNLISPEVRVALGFLAGIGLVVGGVQMKRRELAVTSHTLCATGVVILYAVTFACRSVYHFNFFGPGTTFLLMVLITAVAFTLAVQLNALVVAILGIVGGFLTPVLLSTGTDNPAGLFSYIALLDAGLLAVAFRRRWLFLVFMGAIGTLLLELGWVAEFFVAGKVFIAMTVFLGFDALFCLAFLWAEKRREPSEWIAVAAIMLPFATLALVFYLLTFETLGGRPGVIFSFVLGADLCLLAVVVGRPVLHRVHMAAGTVVFVLLASWTVHYLVPALLYWGLGLYLGFTALHTLFPVMLTRLRPEARRTSWGQVFPALALLLMLLPILKLETISFAIWPAVLLIDLLAIGVAVLAGSAAVILAVLLLTGLATGVWLLRLPNADLSALPELLVVIGGFALFFFIAGLLARPRILAMLGDSAADDQAGTGLRRNLGQNDLAEQLPAVSAILPFLLLIMVSARLPLFNPSPIFGLAMLLIVLLLGLALIAKVDALVPVSIACVMALQYLWHADHFRPELAWVPLAWSVAFYAVFTLFPFLFRTQLQERILPWAVSALAGPLHYYLVHRAANTGPGNPVPGLLPAAFAIPMLLALAHVKRTWPESGMRLNLLAWFGGSALFFITLIVPVQFERQWITIGWALEGLALIWLFHRVPHPGLRATGVVLLAIAFVRLALNPAVLDYHRSASTRVFNWYLYAYGIVTVCLLLGARLLAPPRNRVWGWNITPLLYTLATVLAFLLVNIEIADYFSDGTALTFQFSGNFARDMCYSVAWALFALVLLVIGIWKRQPAPRYAAIGLLLLTLLKLFFHDLSRLDQLYRIGAFIVVAIILIVASFLYQRFVSFDAVREQQPDGTRPSN